MSHLDVLLKAKSRLTGSLFLSDVVVDGSRAQFCLAVALAAFNLAASSRRGLRCSIYCRLSKSEVSKHRTRRAGGYPPPRRALRRSQAASPGRR
jgi:hypothetical protein